MAYKKGDRVEVVKDYSGETKLIGCTGMVVNTDPYQITVELDNGMLVYCDPGELRSHEQFAKKGMMDKLTTLARKVLDRDLRKMVKVGWLDTDLNLTAEGERVVLSEYLFANKEQFGKLAAEILKEEEEEDTKRK